MDVYMFEEIVRKLIENGFSDELVARLIHEYILLNVDEIKEIM